MDSTRRDSGRYPRIGPAGCLSPCSDLDECGLGGVVPRILPASLEVAILLRFFLGFSGTSGRLSALSEGLPSAGPSRSTEIHALTCPWLMKGLGLPRRTGGGGCFALLRGRAMEGGRHAIEGRPGPMVWRPSGETEDVLDPEASTRRHSPSPPPWNGKSRVTPALDEFGGRTLDRASRCRSDLFEQWIGL